MSNSLNSTYHTATSSPSGIKKALLLCLRGVYCLYQLLFCAPVIIITLILCTWATVIGTRIGNPHFWAYHPGRLWSKIIVRVLFLPVTVEGRENLRPDEQYIFMSNHQGAFDIFLIYGYLCRNFKWMMKYQLFRIPFVGATCRAARHIAVDRRSPQKVKKTYDDTHKVLENGMSIVMFPEGARSQTGHMARFKRGGFLLADELQMPIVPLTINGSFDVMPRDKDMHFAVRTPLRLTIHKPIYPISKGNENVKAMMTQTFEAIHSSLSPEYKGLVDNPDQDVP